jgi:hypothetical protein
MLSAFDLSMSMMHAFLSIPFLAILLLLSACTPKREVSSQSEWLIHNPSQESVTMSVDGKSIQLAPKRSEKLMLEAGKHQLETPLTGKLDFIVYVNAKGGLINPTLSTYIIQPVDYTREGEAPTADYWGPMKKTIVLDGVSFEGMYRPVSDLFIDKDWNYAPDEPLPQEIRAYERDAKTVIRNKIYSKPEFFKAMQATPISADAPAIWRAPIKTELSAFESEAMQKASMTLRETYAEYLICADPKRQAEIQQSQMELLNPIVEIYINAAKDLSQKDRETYNALAGGAELWKGARVLIDR